VEKKQLITILKTSSLGKTGLDVLLKNGEILRGTLLSVLWNEKYFNIEKYDPKVTRKVYFDDVKYLKRYR